MRSRTNQSVLVIAGAAVAAAAATWLGKRRLASADSGGEPGEPAPAEPPPSGVATGRTPASSRTQPLQDVKPRAERVDPDSAEPPLDRSPDPELDHALSRKLLPRDETSGATLQLERTPSGRDSLSDASLDEVWSSLPGIAEGGQSEGYDAVSPEDLGSVWLERATQTAHDGRPRASDSRELPALEDLLVSQATLSAFHPAGDDELDGDEQAEEDEIDEPD